LRRINGQVAELDRGVLGLVTPPHESPQTRAQFFKLKGFHQIIVSAQIESTQAVFELIFGR
jgi:hypothetical protein